MGGATGLSPRRKHPHLENFKASRNSIERVLKRRTKMPGDGRMSDSSCKQQSLGKRTPGHEHGRRRCKLDRAENLSHFDLVAKRSKLSRAIGLDLTRHRALLPVASGLGWLSGVECGDLKSEDIDNIAPAAFAHRLVARDDEGVAECF